MVIITPESQELTVQGITVFLFIDNYYQKFVCVDIQQCDCVKPAS